MPGEAGLLMISTIRMEDCSSVHKSVASGMLGSMYSTYYLGNYTNTEKYPCRLR